MSLAVLNSRIKKMECENKPIPQKYIDCFNDYIKKVINTRVDQEVEYLNNIIADKFELGKFKSVNELIYSYKSLEKEYTKSRQRISELEEQLKNAIVLKFKVGQEIWEITPLMSWKIKKIEWHKFNGGNGDDVMEIYKLGHDGTDDYNCCIMPIDNDRFFATKEEAEAKLKELLGERE